MQLLPHGDSVSLWPATKAFLKATSLEELVCTLVGLRPTGEKIVRDLFMETKGTPLISALEANVIARAQGGSGCEFQEVTAAEHEVDVDQCGPHGIGYPYTEPEREVAGVSDQTVAGVSEKVPTWKVWLRAIMRVLGLGYRSRRVCQQVADDRI